MLRSFKQEAPPYPSRVTFFHRVANLQEVLTKRVVLRVAHPPSDRVGMDAESGSREAIFAKWQVTPPYFVYPQFTRINILLSLLAEERVAQLFRSHIVCSCPPQVPALDEVYEFCVTDFGIKFPGL
jgi:hypothetical protein